MIITVMSDSHDNIWNLRRALEMSKQEGALMIIHCGDFVAPFMLTELAATRVPVHGVFGNNDGDRYMLTKLSLTAYSNVTLHGSIGQIDVGPDKIAFTHQEMVAEGLAATGRYRLVCFGHSHEYYVRTLSGTMLLNPGEVMGKEGSPGFCFVDTDTWEIKRVELN